MSNCNIIRFSGSISKNSPKSLHDANQLPQPETPILATASSVISQPAKSEPTNDISDITISASSRYSQSITHEIIKKRDRISSKPRTQGKRPLNITKGASKLSLVMTPDDLEEHESTALVEATDDVEVTSSPGRGNEDYVYDVPNSLLPSPGMISPWLLTEFDLEKLAETQAKLEEEKKIILQSVHCVDASDIPFENYIQRALERKRNDLKELAEAHDARVRELCHLEVHESIPTLDRRNKTNDNEKMQQVRILQAP